MDKKSWHWSAEIKALPQKQSYSSCQFSKQKQGILFSFLKRKVNKILPGSYLLLTPYNHSILMGLSVQDNLRPTPVGTQLHPLFYIPILGLSCFSQCLAGSRGTSFAATCSKMTAPNWASQHYMLLHTKKKIPRSRNLHNFPAASLSDLNIPLCTCKKYDTNKTIKNNSI